MHATRHATWIQQCAPILLVATRCTSLRNVIAAADSHFDLWYMLVLPQHRCWSKRTTDAGPTAAQMLVQPQHRCWSKRTTDAGPNAPQMPQVLSVMLCALRCGAAQRLYHYTTGMLLRLVWYLCIVHHTTVCCDMATLAPLWHCGAENLWRCGAVALRH